MDQVPRGRLWMGRGSCPKSRNAPALALYGQPQESLAVSLDKLALVLGVRQGPGHRGEGRGAASIGGGLPVEAVNRGHGAVELVQEAAIERRGNNQRYC
jgi:hypothetical protein